MRTFFLGFYYALYMIGTGIKALKIKYLKKFKGEEAADEYTNKILVKWANFTLNTMGVKLNVIGRENLLEEPCLFVSNHQSYFDVPSIISVLGKPVGFIAKKELEGIPVISYWMKQIKCIFMDRENIREAIKSINEGIAYLNEGYSMSIFPEGTRAKNGVLGEFKKGSLKLAVKPGVPIIPITIDGTYKAFEEKGKFRKAEANIIIHKPIYTKNLSKEDQNNIAEIVRDIIKESL